MEAELARRILRACNDHPVSPEERRIVAEAAERAQSWDALPDDVKRLVRDIEARVFPTGLL